MTENTVIPIIAHIVEDACKKDTNYFGYGIWEHHIIHVVRFARELAAIASADQEIVEIAALLHDYAGIKDYSLAGEHHIHGAAEAETLLKRMGYPETGIRQVQECILCHRGSIPAEKTTIEAICVSDADAMAHFAAIPSLYYLAFQRHGMGVEEANGWIAGKLERSWNKLSPHGREMVREQYEAFEKLTVPCQ